MPIKPTDSSTISHGGKVLPEKSAAKERLAFVAGLIDEISHNEDPDTVTVQLAERQIKQLGPLDISQEDLRKEVAVLLGKIASISKKKFPSSALWDFDQWLQLRQASPKDYLDLLKILAEQGKESAFFLLDNLDKLNQSLSYDTWIGTRAAQKTISYITSYFTKTKGIAPQPLSQEERFELARSIVNQGPLSAHHLLTNFSKLAPFDMHQPTTRKQMIDFFGFLTTQLKEEDSFTSLYVFISYEMNEQLDTIIKQLKGEPPEIIWDFAQECIGLGEPSVISLAKNLPLLISQGLTTEQILKLALGVVAQGPEAAHALAKVFNQLPLAEFSVAQCVKLANKIIDHGEYPADPFAEKIPDLIARGVSTAQCLELAHRVIESGNYAAGSVAEALEARPLPGLSFDQYYDLAKKITARSQVSAGKFARTFDYRKSPWTGLTVEQRFGLAEITVFQGENGAYQVLEHFHQFGLSEAPPEELQSLGTKILFSGSSACAELLNHLSDGYDLFHLRALPVQERVNLAKECVKRHGMNILTTLGVDLFSSFSLNELSYPERLELISFFSEYTERTCAPTLNCFERKKIPGQTEGEEFQAFLEFSRAPHQAMKKVPLSDGILKKYQPIIELLSDATITEEIDEAKLANFKAFIATSFPVMSPLVERASLEKDPFVRKRVISWLAYTAGVLSSLDAEHVEAIKKSQILTEIYEYRDPQMRYKLVRKSSFLSGDTISQVSAITQNKKASTKLAAILLAPLLERGILLSELQELIGSIETTRGFRDVRNTKTLIDFLYAITSSRKLSPEKSKQVIALPYEQPSAKVIKQLSLVSLILKTFGEEKFEETEELAPEKILIEALTKSFTFSHPITDLEQKYQRTFGSFRDNTALLTYRNRLEELPPHEHDASVALLTTYVESVLEGSFPDVRYRTDNNTHLKRVFEAMPGLEERWRTAPASASVSEVSSRYEKAFLPTGEETKEATRSTAEKAQEASAKFTSVIQEHLDLSQYPHLQNYQQKITTEEKEGIKSELLRLKRAPARKLEMLKKLEQRKVKGKTVEKFLKELGIDNTSFEDEAWRKVFKEEIQLELAKLETQIHAIDLCDPKRPLSQKKATIQGIYRSIDLLPHSDNFRKELTSTIEEYSQQTQAPTKFFVEESDEPCDLMQQGSEFGTCQKVDGDVRVNKCLAGALMDGKIKVLTVKGGSKEKSKENPMLARSIIRLLWDKTEQRPVLFLEECYGSHPNHETFDKAIKQWAIMRAQELGVSLVFQPFSPSQATVGKPFDREVEALGSFPFEYTDSTTNQGMGVQAESKYTIGNCRILYSQEDDSVASTLVAVET